MKTSAETTTNAALPRSPFATAVFSETFLHQMLLYHIGSDFTTCPNARRDLAVLREKLESWAENASLGG
jgi:hypothetical protein